MGEEPVRLGRELLGLPVRAGRSDGPTLGHVADLWLDLSQGRLAGLLVETGDQRVTLPVDPSDRLEQAAVVLTGVDPQRGPEKPQPADTTNWLRLVGDGPDGGGPGLCGLRVADGSGRPLGRWEDVWIDTRRGTLEAVELSQGLIEDVIHGRKAVPLSGLLAVGPRRALLEPPQSGPEAQTAAPPAQPDAGPENARPGPSEAPPTR